MEKESLGKPSQRKMKIRRISLVDQVCASIKQDIVDGIWKAGDKLPSESDFADTFGVNRLSVRMALQKLSTLGIIETRVGEGSFVRDFSLKPMLSEISVFYESKDCYDDVRQLRSLLEYECMRLAILSGTDAEKEELHNALIHYNDLALKYNLDMDNEDALKRLVDADFDFHYKIIKMSHNRLYKDVYFMVQQLIRSNITQLVRTRTHRRAEAGLPPLGESDTHNKIYNCIINSDPTLLREITDELLGIKPVEGMDVFNEQNCTAEKEHSKTDQGYHHDDNVTKNN
ncbi:MAG: FadR family transcriptional regulator [Clostridiales bacterium]|jgi:GntR family transcriptional repressor for pyruvate dehydrogenase complex|nr:FadR family transcriptional regulator [Clostridiales bacterium]MCI2160291.1 FadR family transcriptional regulator [Oscillospiraceae bacterium]MCI2021518.1 FadR family transcriptional regulator [Clostridiales bacterium]MCI2026304.1 FadR family transcriptional regulator [Clostridiales bacterium]MCI2191575.1 FadR family transcriptional regulator [Oscillospiraceae bacterium]